MQNLKNTLRELERKTSSHPILSHLWILVLTERAIKLQQDIKTAHNVLREMEHHPDIHIEQFRTICLMYGYENTA